MSLHKLTAGDGYTYLTRQVAAADATHRGYDSLGDYYAQKGESPGVWMGRGLAAVPDLDGADGAPRARPGYAVREAQMRALFGLGRHPDAELIEARLHAGGQSAAAVSAATQLGLPFKTFDGATSYRRRVAAEFAACNTARGLPGDWPVPAEERAWIRTKLGRAMFAEAYDRPAGDERELSGFLARVSRQPTSAVAGYDLTFSPVKSVSALWALAPLATARVIEQAHADAVTDTLRWLEDHAVFTRSGHRSAQQIEVHGLLAAAFTHRDSRAGDPDLHTHVAISNKVQALDGRWLALDGRPLHKMIVAASERYNTRLEALLVDRLGVGFAERQDNVPDRRPVREIVGVDAGLLRTWSARRRVIDVRRTELTTAFQDAHGRGPTTVEALALAQQATLETRRGKHEPRSFAEQRQTWRSQALAVLGGERGLARMLYVAAHPPAHHPTAMTDRWVSDAAARVLATVQGERATWQECHVRAEAERVTRAAAIPLAALNATVEALVAAVLAPERSLPLGPPGDPVAEPAQLRRADGRSVYTTVGTQLYSSAEIMAAEASLLAAAQRGGRRRVSPRAVEVALLEATANGVELNPGQVALVRELAGSGATCQLALAPAGVGKTTALSVLAASWRTDGGTVLGLAPSAAAAAVLRAELDPTGSAGAVHTDTLAKLLDATRPDRPDRADGLPGWVSGIGPGTLVLVDEAGMAGTLDLASAVEFVAGRGGSVRLIGDDQQLAAIGAGGVLRDIAHTTGAVTLSHVVRFTNPTSGRAEAAASLALRAGDPAAIGFYLDHARVHVGDLATATERAYRAWAVDRAAGRDALLIAPTRQIAATLNARARADRLATEPEARVREVALADGSSASTGELVIARRNRRDLPITATDWVKNGDRFRVTAVCADGALEVAHVTTGRRLSLPADYASRHVGLGYASTVHTAQGSTADVCHLVATGEETRQLLYVGLTRGRQANHVYLAVAGDGDPHSVITRDALRPPTAGDVLARVLARDGAAASATTTGRELAAPARRLAAAATCYYDALVAAGASRLGPAGTARVDAAAEAALPGLTAAPAYPTLRGALGLLALDGHDPIRALRAAIEQRELGTAGDPAAVLHWRLDPTLPDGAKGQRSGPLPWLPAVPAALADDAHWGDYLPARATLVRELAAQVADEARGWTATTAASWAAGLIAADGDVGRDLVADVAVWRAATEVDPADPAPTGPPCTLVAETRHQRRLDNRVHAVLGEPGRAAHRWQPLATDVAPRVLGDPYWPQLAARLDTAARARIDITALTRRVASERQLPDEAPAAALWWRLTQHLSPAALSADAGTVELRPSWLPALTELVGADVAARIVTDPTWPALVAAVSDASAHGWQPADLLEAAHALIGHTGAGPLRPEELATGLLWRIGTLTTAPEPDGDEATLSSIDPPSPGEDPSEDMPGPAISPSPAPTDPTVVDKLDAMFAFDRYAAPVTDPTDVLVAEHKWATAPVARQRLVELNALAMDYYAARYPSSWAADYMIRRLGTDLTADARFRLGYAPPGWTHLLGHLRHAGASDDELVAAGLASRTRTGRLIDVFRDRLIFPVRDGQEIVAFIARANPSVADAGPKYLNTRSTDLFVKGRHLYGLAETVVDLADGATPVLVEGVIDAIAVTLAGGGAFAGLAPSGTAFTDAQADRLRPYIQSRRMGVIVATDADPAGAAATRRAYWLLTARGDTPRHLRLPDGQDPADVMAAAGAAALRERLQHAGSLARLLVDERLDAHALTRAGSQDVEQAVAAVAAILAALPPDQWLAPIAEVSRRLDVPAGRLQQETLDTACTWIRDPAVAARRRLAHRRPASTQPAPQQVGEPATPMVDEQPGLARNHARPAPTPSR